MIVTALPVSAWGALIVAAVLIVPVIGDGEQTGPEPGESTKEFIPAIILRPERLTSLGSNLAVLISRRIEADVVDASATTEVSRATRVRQLRSASTLTHH